MAKSRAIAVRRVYVSKSKRRRASGIKVPLASILGFVPLMQEMYQGYTEFGIRGAGWYGLAATTGYSLWDKKWHPALMAKGLLPIVLGIGVHKLASKLGVNRALASAGIPFIRV